MDDRFSKPTQEKLELIEKCTIAAYNFRRKKTGSGPWEFRSPNDQRKYREIVVSAFAELERLGKEIVDHNPFETWSIPVATLEKWRSLAASGNIISLASAIDDEIMFARKELADGS